MKKITNPVVKYEWKIDDYMKGDFIDSILDLGERELVDYTILEAADSYIRMTTRQALMNLMVLKPFTYFKVIPQKVDFKRYNTYTPADTSKIFSPVYIYLLLKFLKKPHVEILDQVYRAVNYLQDFAYVDAGGYMPGIDVYGLAEIHKHPALVELIEKKYSDDMDPTLVEASIRKDCATLVATILDDTKMGDNVLRPLLEVGALKHNQVALGLNKTGRRSDINDRVMKHVVNPSNIQGLQNVADFAVEALGGKKAIFNNKKTLPEAQYSNRMIKLMVCRYPYLHGGDCGQKDRTIDMYIREEYKSNFIGKAIMDGKKMIFLDQKNINSFTNQTVPMVSQIKCLHTNGMCDVCAGWGFNMTHRFYPPNINIGMYHGTTVASDNSQTTMSSKHFMETNSMRYIIPDSARQYLVVKGNELNWLPTKVKDAKKLSFRIPNRCMGLLSDLMLEDPPEADMFSEINHLDLVDSELNVVDTIETGTTSVTPFLSKAILDYAKNFFMLHKEDENFVYINLAKFDFTKPILSFEVLNDDMTRQVKRVKRFLTTQIRHYTDVSTALLETSDLFYHKIKVNIFYLETILRNCIVNNLVDCRIPLVEDPNNVKIGGLSAVISNSSVSTKFGFQDVKAYLSDPINMLTPRARGFYFAQFGMIDHKDDIMDDQLARNLDTYIPLKHKVIG